MHCRPSLPALCVWLISASGLAPLAGEGQNVEEPGFRIKRWTTDDGLPQSRIACLKQTRDGYLWIGTWAGLARFDGIVFSVFNKFNTPALANDAINALAEDSQGTLWIGTPSGLVSYRQNNFQRHKISDQMPDENISQLAPCRTGEVWAQAGKDVARISGRQFSQVRRVVAPGDSIRSIHEGPDGWLNIFTERSWLALSSDADRLRTNYVAPEGAPAFLAGWLGRETNVSWVGTVEGLRRIDQGEATDASAPNHQAVSFIYQDRFGVLWLGGKDGGLYFGKDKHWTSLDLRQGATVAMEEDQEGNCWVGNELGLTQLQRPAVRTYTTRDGLAHDNVLSVCEASDGAIWAGTAHGVSRFQGNGFAGFAAEEKQLFQFPDRSVWPNAHGGVWLNKPGYGLVEFQEGQLATLFNVQQFPHSLNALYGDRSGRLWLGTAQGAFAFSEGHLQIPEGPAAGDLIKCATGLGDVRSILEDREGTFWFGRRKQGLARFRKGVVSSFTERDGLSNNNVWSLLEDQNGTLWIGTDNGFTRYREGRFFAFTQRHGLPERTVNCVLQDDLDNLWLSGLHGIHRVERAQLDAVAEGRAPTAQFVTLGAADGMEHPETNGGENQPAGWKARDGRLWFPTIRGVVVIDPKTIPVNESPPPVLLEQVKADGQVVFGETTIVGDPPQAVAGDLQPTTGRGPRKIPPGRAHLLEFRFTANTFLNPERVPFRYRLIGADADWREEVGERNVRYLNLRPGAYRFEVTAANHHKVWNPQPAAFAFSLAPHYWQTWPFYFLCAGAVVGLAGAVQGYRLKWQHRFLKLEQQRAVAGERSRIARDLHDDLGASLTGIALQLEAARGRGKAEGHELGALAGEARSLSHDLRELAWTINPRCDNALSLVAFTGEFAERFCQAAGLDCRLELPPGEVSSIVPARIRHELLVVLKESLANIARHAHARRVTVRMAVQDHEVNLAIQDDGQGFDPARVVAGMGLRNLRERAQNAGASLEVESAPGQGTIVRTRWPLSLADHPQL